MQKITITLHETVFGTIVKEFTTMIDALHFMQICVSNDANFSVDIQALR